MPFIEPLTPRHRRWWWPTLVALSTCLSACQWLPSKPDGQAARPAKGAEPAPPDARAAIDEAEARIDATSPTTGAKGKGSARGAAVAKAQPLVKLPPPARPSSLADVRRQSAKRLLAANPGITYTSRPPDVLLAIPVLTVDLNADGSIRRIEVMRYPRQARDTVEIAKEALRRAAPFGNVSHLPRPWRFNETFLFNDQRRFKPLTLDR